MTVRAYRKKPVVIQAIQFTENTCAEVLAFLGADHDDDTHPHTFINIPTLEGFMLAEPGDWIIKGIEGEYYPCKDSVFRKTYQVV